MCILNYYLFLINILKKTIKTIQSYNHIRFLQNQILLEKVSFFEILNLLKQCSLYKNEWL